MVPMADISPLKKDPCSGKTVLEIKNGMLSNEVLRLPRRPEETETFLAALKPKKSSSYSTEPLFKALCSLGQPHKKMGRIIHVTGSNGKTSVSSFCAAFSMKVLGLKTGLYTSPHISSLTERIQINAKKISMGELFKAVLAVASKAPFPLSYFELMTAAAFLVFSQKKTEAAVIEAGLGGGRDATNVVNGDVCVFTPVTTEHRDIIGPELRDICLEKAGIIKKGSIVISSFKNTGIIEKIFKSESIKKRALFSLSKKIESDRDWQEENIKLASEAVSAFSGVDISGLLSSEGCIKKYSPPARYEKLLYGDRFIVFDGAHNPQAFRKLLEGRRFGCAMVSFLSDKDVAGCLAELERSCEKIIISSCSSYRAIEPEKIFTYAIDKRKYIVEKNLPLAIKKAFLIDKSLLVTGSLYFCSDVKAFIERRKISHPREMIEKS
ncbi:MAG: folylpolyglutamate synthase/dihydrofolate synthase family protein [Elusimicrobiota bacterium]